MAYDVQEIEGVGAKFAAKLAGIGIHNTDDLLSKARTPAGRAAVSDEGLIRPDLVLTWANRADLMRLKGVGGQFAELLNVAGVDTIKELRRRNAANLRAKMVEINESRKVSRTAPSEAQVAGWVEQAKSLEPSLEY
jgi:predicted flap endonuclease-1-like 5' DNA nuclease